MKQDTLDKNWVLRCPECRLPLSDCLCPTESYLCRDCPTIEQSRVARRRKKIVDSAGVPRWAYVSDYRCRRCQYNATQRTYYKTQKRRAISQERQTQEIIWKHPLYAWVQKARKDASAIEHVRLTHPPKTLDLSVLARAYYRQYINYLRRYADEIEQTIRADVLAGQHADYDTEGPLGYPPGHKPSSKDVQARLPVDQRRELFSLAHVAGLDKAQKLWSALNRRYRR